MSWIVIAGGPRTGKTTLADKLAASGLHGVPVRHTDDLISRLSWSDASAEVARWFEVSEPWIVEGVAAVRALRKFLATHLRGAHPPASTVYWLETPMVPRTPGQEAMAKGCATVWAEVFPELLARGVEVIRHR